MRLADLPFRNILRLTRNDRYPEIFDVEAERSGRFPRFSSLECHIVVYPYSRRVSAAQFTFMPFEEYVKDLQSQRRSVYRPIVSQFAKFFGLLLGGCIALLFYLFSPQSLFSLESLVSLLGAYFIGKELWSDLERLLLDLTKNLPLRYQEDYYRYKLEKRTTLTHYSRLAKKKRYGVASLLPEKMDFIQQSNSQTLRLFFKKDCLTQMAAENGHLFSLHLDAPALAPFIEEGYMLGLKLSFNRRFLGLTRSVELFQSLDNGRSGCADEKGRWRNGAVFFRITARAGRIKLFLRRGCLEKESLFAPANGGQG